MDISPATGSFARDAPMKSASALTARLAILPLTRGTVGHRATHQNKPKRGLIIVAFPKVESNRLAWLGGCRLHSLRAPGSSAIGMTFPNKSGGCNTGEGNQDCSGMNRPVVAGRFAWVVAAAAAKTALATIQPYREAFPRRFEHYKH